jgi:hypothetical protein
VLPTENHHDGIEPGQEFRTKCPGIPKEDNVSDGEKKGRLAHRGAWNVAGSIAAIVSIVATVTISYIGLINDVNKLQTDYEELEGRVEVIQKSMADARAGRVACEWRKVGYDKSHGHEPSSWCQEGEFIAQIDLDGLTEENTPSDKDPHELNFPIVGSVFCCPVFP